METKTGEQPPEDAVTDIWFSKNSVTVQYASGRASTIPLGWYPGLDRARRHQRRNFEICSNGRGIHWPELNLLLLA